VFSATTSELLKKKLPSLPHMVMEKELARDIDELVAGVLSPQKLAVVDDVHTADAYGNRVYRALKGRFPCTHVTLDKYPLADDLAVQRLRTQTLSADALVAVGSGTVNDLCKYVSHLDRKPYLVFPTAASMNGYLSANASITVSGHKKTMLAFMPQAVFCDLSVIADAPPRLNKSGFGDSLARSTAQADWLLSHLLLDTHYDETPFALLKDIEPQLLDQARGIALADVRSMELLMKTLLLSGLGMTIAGGSYPASQGEHMIAHSHEMFFMRAAHLINKEHKTLHGEEIGVTTLTMAAMQEKMLRAKPKLRPNDFSTEQMISLAGSDIATHARKAFDGKQALVQHSSAEEVLKKWGDIAARIEPVMISSSKLTAILKAAEAPANCAALKWSQKDYDVTVGYARYTRERFTFLDLQLS